MLNRLSLKELRKGIFLSMETENIDEVFQEFENSKKIIDQEHKEIMDEILEGEREAERYELLYHLANPEGP